MQAPAVNEKRKEKSPIIFVGDEINTPGLDVVNRHYLADETQCVDRLVEIARLTDAENVRVRARAEQLVRAVREHRAKQGGLDAFLQKYDLSSQEGVVLMCLAEALLRIPDADTADKLIRDKLTEANWEEHLDSGDSMFVNASTWGLMLTGRIVAIDPQAESLRTYMKRLVARVGEPVIRTALRQAMRIMGHQFVMGQTIEEALKRAHSAENRIYRYSFDMLGEAALTSRDARRYFEAYVHAIETLGRKHQMSDSVFAAPSVSVKLSALHPRYEFAQARHCVPAMGESLLELARIAREQNVALTVDAEEADRLEISLAIFDRVFGQPLLGDWEGLGLALQAYQKRALAVVDWLKTRSRERARRIPLRLVKGAYWDTEIKQTQELGLESYPVFTRKSSTDVSYLACARRIFDANHAFYPQFATHNARTAAHILELSGYHGGEKKEFEFQRLHGMGEELFEEIVGEDKLGVACRVYAPVGSHKDLLPYLVRRLLENGANTSFVNRIIDAKIPISDIIQDPVALTEGFAYKPHPKIPLPRDMYGDTRRNSKGINLNDRAELELLHAGITEALGQQARATPIVDGQMLDGPVQDLFDPADRRRRIGQVVDADRAAVDRALTRASAAQMDWNRTPVQERAKILRQTADLYEANASRLIGLCVREAGKSIPDSLAELREAVDFLRYYAYRAEVDFSQPLNLLGPTGESNQLSLHGRGVFVCISPWNFPLAIFTGQVAAALVAGNSVAAKPAEQTPLIAALATKLAHQAGVPEEVLHLLPGAGQVVGAAATADPRVAGVAFTGSTETARRINLSLAQRDAPIATLIAETGGQNAMIVDSSALPEQVVLDAVQSAFNSAGQRCSALRVLCVQEEIAPRILELLKGHMEELNVGDPALLETDVGPVIDREALTSLEQHAEHISTIGRVLHRVPASDTLSFGTFFMPLAVEIDEISLLEREVFGPILHIVRYRARDLDALIAAINQTGYGLTLGVHSRIDSSARYINARCAVGNTYVNRNMVGATVGVQPFGGRGLSGTGPKAGGPHYLSRFSTERTLTINTAAVGGNASLLSLSTD